MTITTKLIEDLIEYKGAEFAALVVMAHGIHLTTKPSKKDMCKGGGFGRKVNDKIKSALWSLDEDLVSEVLFVNSLIGSYEIGQALHGLGGCVQKSFSELAELA
jgi:hypothetical protein